MKETKLGSCSLEILKDNVLAPLNRPEEERRGRGSEG